MLGIRRLRREVEAADLDLHRDPLRGVSDQCVLPCRAAGETAFGEHGLAAEARGWPTPQGSPFRGR